jgi:hypothetical protein
MYKASQGLHNRTAKSGDPFYSRDAPDRRSIFVLRPQSGSDTNADKVTSMGAENKYDEIANGILRTRLQLLSPQVIALPDTGASA